MKVTIVSADNHDSHCVARFQCRTGTGLARWAGREPPAVGRPISAELDCHAVISFGANASFGKSGALGVAELGGGLLSIQAYVEGQDDDGMTYLRLSEDCIIMVESLETGLEGAWLHFVVAADQITLTPSGG